MMNCPRNGYETFGTMSPETVQAHMAHMRDLNDSLRASVELVSGEGLADPREAKNVRAGKNGTPVIDGAFAETKEFLAGYWLVDVKTPERAYEIAARASSAPVEGGVPANFPVEVRQVMGPPPQTS
jgi:hypothetical protein